MDNPVLNDIGSAIYPSYESNVEHEEGSAINDAEKAKNLRDINVSTETDIHAFATLQGIVRSNDGNWTGGASIGLGGLFKLGVWGFGDKRDYHVLSLGIQTELDVTAHHEYGWTSLLHSGSLALSLASYNPNSGRRTYFAYKDAPHHMKDTRRRFIISGGYASNYMPVVDSRNVEHGWTSSFEYFIPNWGHVVPGQTGFVTRLLHFPDHNDFIFQFGLKFLSGW